MIRQHFHSVAAALLACASCVLISQSTRADEPAGEVRYFFELLYSNPSEPGHDFEVAGSRRIVSHYEEGGEIRFGRSTYAADRYIYDADGNVLLDVRNTRWVPSSVLHITDDGVETMELYWLVGEEDDSQSLRRMLTGATSATGPDGDVVTLADVGATVDSYGELRLTADAEPLYRLRVSMGWFQK